MLYTKNPTQGPVTADVSGSKSITITSPASREMKPHSMAYDMPQIAIDALNLRLSKDLEKPPPVEC